MNKFFVADTPCLPCAKINLGLNVVEKRPDGYHNIETAFYAIPLTDVLEIKPLENGDAEEVQFLGMPKEDSPESNLVYKVYDDLRKEFNLPPMSLYLYKHIPTAYRATGQTAPFL